VIGLKFRLKKGKGSVNRFTDSDGAHYPGDMVDLPACMKGEKWLEPVEPEKKVRAPSAKVEKIGAPEGVPLPSIKKSDSKKSKTPES
jgi:hypothetical protein